MNPYLGGWEATLRRLVLCGLFGAASAWVAGCGGDATRVVVSLDVDAEDDAVIFWRALDTSGQLVFEACGEFGDEAEYRGRPFSVFAPRDGESDRSFVSHILLQDASSARDVLAHGVYENGAETQLVLGLSTCSPACADNQSCVDGVCMDPCFVAGPVDSDSPSPPTDCSHAPMAALHACANHPDALLCEDFEPGLMAGTFAPRGIVDARRYECEADRAHWGIGAHRVIATTTSADERSGVPYRMTEIPAANFENELLRIRIWLRVDDRPAGFQLFAVWTGDLRENIRLDVNGFADPTTLNYTLHSTSQGEGTVDYVHPTPMGEWNCLEWAIPMRAEDAEVEMFVGEASQGLQTLQPYGAGRASIGRVDVGLNSVNSPGESADISVDDIVLQLGGEPIGCER